MSKNECYVKLTNYDLPFLFWGHKGDCIIGCDKLILRFNYLFEYPEEAKEIGLETNKIYYPSLLASRIKQVYKNGKIKLYPYRRRKSIVVDPNPLEEDVGIVSLREICLDRLKVNVHQRKVIITEWDDDHVEIDVGDRLIVSKDLVEIAEELTGDELTNREGIMRDGYVTIKGDDYVVSISGRQPE